MAEGDAPTGKAGGGAVDGPSVVQAEEPDTSRVPWRVARPHHQELPPASAASPGSIVVAEPVGNRRHRITSVRNPLYPRRTWHPAVASAMGTAAFVFGLTVLAARYATPAQGGCFCQCG